MTSVPPATGRASPRRPGPHRFLHERLFGSCLGLLALILTADRVPVRGLDRAVAAQAAERRPAVAGALARASRDAVLIAGNSHADRAGTGELSCGPLVNAGLAGAQAAEVTAFLAGLPVAAPARRGVLIVGTNDILRTKSPLSGAARARFAAEAAASLAWLEAHTRTLVVAAVPPIGRDAVGKRDPAAVAVYSEILSGLCRAPTCRFVDPFAALRADEPGLARPGALSDTVHLADYPAMLTALDLCRAEPPSEPPRDSPREPQREPQRLPGSEASASGVSR